MGDINVMNVLQVYCVAGNVDKVRETLEGGTSPDAGHPETKTSPLYLACKNNHYEVAEVLLKAGATLHLCDELCWRAIDNAAAHGHWKSVRILMKYGETAGPAKDGWTPLMLAAQNNLPKVIAELLLGGADIDFKLNDTRPNFFAPYRTCDMVAVHHAVVSKNFDRGQSLTLLLAAGADAWVRQQRENLLPIGRANEAHNELARQILLAATRPHSLLLALNVCRRIAMLPVDNYVACTIALEVWEREHPLLNDMWLLLSLNSDVHDGATLLNSLRPPAFKRHRTWQLVEEDFFPLVNYCRHREGPVAVNANAAEFWAFCEQELQMCVFENDDVKEHLLTMNE